MTLLDLQATPFDLQQGDLVQAKVTATNNYGDSAISDANTAGALIETVPHIPTIAPTRGSNTGETQVEVIITPLTGLETGGSPITSYVILWDQGLGGAFSVLKGDVTPNLDTTNLFTSGITSGTVYRFAYYAKNAHGDGWDGVQILPEVSILAGTTPS